jgi:hypothetical protein
MIPALVLAFLVGWPQPGPGPSAAPASSCQWQAPAGDPAANPWTFYGDPLVAPREVVCLRPEWIYIGQYRALYPGVCWSRRIYRRHAW